MLLMSKLRPYLHLGAFMYNRALDKYPIPTQMVTSAALWCAGDLAAQRLEARVGDFAMDSSTSSTEHQYKSIDWHRTAAQTFYASCVWAPLAHHWYELLDTIAHRIAKTGALSAMVARQAKSGSILGSSRGALVAIKLVIEIVALHPISLLAYFAGIGFLNGDSRNEIVSQIKRDFFPTLALEVALWTPLDVSNFQFVPVRHQLLVVNCGCFIESVGLSFIKKNGIVLPGMD